jgi:hypothetical protein
LTFVVVVVVVAGARQLAPACAERIYKGEESRGRSAAAAPAYLASAVRRVRDPRRVGVEPPVIAVGAIGSKICAAAVVPRVVPRPPPADSDAA